MIACITQIYPRQSVLTVYQIHDQRPVAARPNYSDVSTTEKFELSDSTYETLPNSVLAWKKAQKLGRFDPNAASPEDKARQQVQKDVNEIKAKGTSCPCLILFKSLTRRCFINRN